MWTLTPGTEAGRRGDAVGVEQGHNLNRPKDGSGPDAAAPASRRRNTPLAQEWPPRHRRNRWDKSGRRGAAPAICSADRYVWAKRKGRAAAFSSHPTSGRRARQRPGAPKETPSHGPRRLGAARPVGRFRFNRMLRPPARAGLSAAAAAEIRRSRGKGPARHRRYAFSPQPPDRHGPAGGRSANGKNSRSKRLTRLRTTALPTLRENSHARARTIADMLSRKHKQEEMLGMVTSAPLITGGKFRPAANTDVPWKGQTRHKSPRRTTRAVIPVRLGTQVFAALGATAAQNGAAAGGSHAGAETVGAGSSDFTGLVCSFHDSAPFSFLRTPPATMAR